MKALTALSKYLGCYDGWNKTRRQYNLKWTTGNESLQSLQRFFDANLTLESMLQRVFTRGKYGMELSLFLDNSQTKLLPLPCPC